MKTPLLTSRRHFLGQSLAIGSLAVGSRSLLAQSANERINVGIVGCGWRGGQLKEFFSKIEGVHIAGLCDPDEERLHKAAEGLAKVQTWADMRHMFDSADIDAVVIANPNHWHCLSAIWAMQAGKHVYVEKPLGQTQWEGQQLVNAVRKYGRICQVGTQQRSDPMQAEIRDFLHNEKALGTLERVTVPRRGERKSIGKRAEALPIPRTVDYNLWLGPAENLPLYRDQLQYDWHWMWNTGSGEMGNWGVHLLDDVRGTIFRDTVSIPTKVTATGGRHLWSDAGETPNLHFAILDAGGTPVTIAVCNLARKEGLPPMQGPASGYIAHYEGGRYEGQRGKGEAFDTDGKLLRSFQGTGGNGAHQQNFIDAIRANAPQLLNAPSETGFASTSWCNLANIASRVPTVEQSSQGSQALVEAFGKQGVQQSLDFMRQVTESHVVGNAPSEPQLGPVLSFDADTGRFTGPQAEVGNQFLQRKDREPFVVPAIPSV